MSADPCGESGFRRFIAMGSESAHQWSSFLVGRAFDEFPNPYRMSDHLRLAAEAKAAGALLEMKKFWDKNHCVIS